MTDYERHLPQPEPHHMHLPPVEQSWTIGTVLAATMSLVSVISVLVAIIWGYAKVTYATDFIPSIQASVMAQRDANEINRQDISNLKIQQSYNDAHYAEILIQLHQLDAKMDRLNDGKADKQMKGWTR